MKVCQLAIFPMLLNASALQGDIVGLEGHLQQVTLPRVLLLVDIYIFVYI